MNMRYAVLVAPHQNQRYNAGVQTLTLSELTLMLSPYGITPEFINLNGLDLISFEAEESRRTQMLLSRLSSLYVLFKLQNDALYPVQLEYSRVVEDDISGVLKYKGKTNEVFTSLLINAAVFSSDYAGRFDEKLNILDPICGRGTTLFEALKKDYNAYGVEIDKADIDELNKYFKKYLEFHKLKHSVTKNSMTVNGKSGGARTSYKLALDSKQLKESPLELINIHGSTTNCPSYFKKDFFHAIAADLPYGVQHAGQDGRKPIAPASLLEKCAPAWAHVLKPGGAIAISFNVNTLPLHTARNLLYKNGLKPLEGGVYDTFEHWVEQAVTRDIAVAIKE